jgi:hypothetical protein
MRGRFTCRHRVQSKSFWNFNLGNPRTKLSPHSSKTTNQNSRERTSYAGSKARLEPSNQPPRRTTILRKICTNDLTLGDDRIEKIASRMRHTRSPHLESGLKTIIKNLGNRKQIETKRLDKSNTLQITLSLPFVVPIERIRPRTLSPKVMYSLHTTGVRLENHC